MHLMSQAEDTHAHSHPRCDLSQVFLTQLFLRTYQFWQQTDPRLHCWCQNGSNLKER